MRKISKIIATVFFIGYFPLAPGTIASLAALPFCIFLQNSVTYIFFTALFITAGFWSAGRAKGYFSGSDPREIVIDEFSSMFLVYLFIPFSITLTVAGFLLFRIFDIFKIPTIKKLEKLPGGFGIMLDDIAAAILTNLILRILIFLPGPKMF